MTGEEFKQLRHDLGNSIGRPISRTDMGRLCGLAPGNANDTIRKWEEGSGPSGPVSRLASILRLACYKYPLENLPSLAGMVPLDGSTKPSPPHVERIIRAAIGAEIVAALDD